MSFEALMRYGYAGAAAALLLTACSGIDGPATSETIDGEYVRRSIIWQDTDVVTSVMVRVEQAGDRTRVCAAYFAEGTEYYTAEIVEQVRGAARIVHGSRTVLRSLRAFPGPLQGRGDRGVQANCVVTTTPWRPEFDDPGPLRLDPARVATT